MRSFHQVYFFCATVMWLTFSMIYHYGGNQVAQWGSLVVCHVHLVAFVLVLPTERDE